MEFSINSFYNKKIKHISFFLLFIMILITNILNLEYKKNKNIKVSEKLEEKRVLEVEDPSIVENKINLKKSNFMIIYYAHWCSHW